MNWYVREGWYSLIEELLDKLNVVCEDKHIYIQEVKEKFGGMRVWAEGDTTDEVWNLIEEYENKSYTICEVCGKPGKYRDELAWKQTLCDHCFGKINE